MEQRKESRHIIDTLFVLALFVIFALCALVLVSIGADVYQKTVNNMDKNYNSRTAFSYVTEKIRQNDEGGAFEVREVDGVTAVVLSKEIDGNMYHTYLYEHDGYLKELFAGDSLPFGESVFSAGQALIPVKSFSLEQINDSLISFEVTSEDGETLQLFLSEKSERGQS